MTDEEGIIYVKGEFENMIDILDETDEINIGLLHEFNKKTKKMGMNMLVYGYKKLSAK